MTNSDFLSFFNQKKPQLVCESAVYKVIDSVEIFYENARFFTRLAVSDKS